MGIRDWFSRKEEQAAPIAVHDEVEQRAEPKLADNREALADKYLNLRDGPMNEQTIPAMARAREQWLEAEASRPARGFSPHNLQAAVDRYEQNMRDRGSRFERSDVLAQERSLAPDVVQKLAEYRGLRETLKQAEKAASVPVLGQEHVMSYVDAKEAMSNWAYSNRVQVAGFSHQIDAREHAQPGRSYAGPVVSLTDTHVVQQVGEQVLQKEGITAAQVLDRYGQEMRDNFERSVDGEPRYVKTGEWRMLDDGMTETRPVVVEINGTMHRGEEESHRGGEPNLHLMAEIAKPHNSYAGPIVDVTPTHVVQSVDGFNVEHERRALLRGDVALTKEAIGKEVSIEYPAGKFGLVREPEMERKVEAPVLRHEFGTR